MKQFTTPIRMHFLLHNFAFVSQKESTPKIYLYHSHDFIVLNSIKKILEIESTDFYIKIHSQYSVHIFLNNNIQKQFTA